MKGDTDIGLFTKPSKLGENMIVSSYQPYFAPFPGFFSKALRSDALVLMDSVQFPRGSTWLTRNRFKNDQGTLWVRIPVWKKGLGLQKINEVKICHEGDTAKKQIVSLQTAYAGAPFFEDHLPFLKETFSGTIETLLELNVRIIRYLMDCLRIETRLVFLSDLGVETKEPRLSVEICKKLGGSHFLAQAGAKKYLDQKAFHEAGIDLKYFRPRPPVYPQLWGSFISNLSTLDLVFNCGPASRKIIKAL